jgi:hypothetical protein
MSHIAIKHRLVADTPGSKRDRGVVIKPGRLQGIMQHDSGRGVDAILLSNLM